MQIDKKCFDFVQFFSCVAASMIVILTIFICKGKNTHNTCSITDQRKSLNSVRAL